MKITKYYLLFLLSVVIFLTTTAYLSKGKSEYVKKEKVFKTETIYDNSQIIKFNHKIHTVDAEIKCEDCHKKALTSVSSKDNLNKSVEFTFYSTG